MQARKKGKLSTKYVLSQVNSGSGLTPEEGIFKAPKEGNYYFQFHGLVRKWNPKKNLKNNTITDGGSTAPLYCWYQTEEKTI